jgi:hypothetical protein
VPACGGQGTRIRWGRSFVKENNISIGKVNQKGSRETHSEKND